MARLPIPGSDDQTWGEILNEFLRVEHNEDGTLNPAGSLSGKYTLPSSGIPETDLATAVQAKINAATQDLSGLVPKTTTVNGHALTSNVTVTKSDIGLSDVNNTADAAKPISTATQTALNAKADTTALTGGLAGKADSVHGHAIADVTNLQSSLNAKYNLPAGGIPQSDLSDAVQTKLDNGGVITDGSIGSAKLADNAVTSIKIQNEAVTKLKLSTALQTSIDKADSALQTIADGTIGTAKLADNAVTAVKITDATITEAKLSSAVQSKLNQAGPDLSNYVAKTTTVNGHALSGNVDVTKADVGLGAVDDTADANKPISNATQTALDAKAATTALTSGLAAKANTVHTHAIDDVGDLQSTLDAKYVRPGGGIPEADLATAVQSKLNQAGPDLSGYVQKTTTVNGHALSGNVSVVKADVGLGNVDNTADVNKPISNATQTALDAKAAKTYVDGELATKQHTISLTTAGTDGVATFNSGTGVLNVPQYVGAVTSVNTKTGAVVLAKADIGLGNVDNTADVNKPISNATQTALDAKAATIDVTAALATKANTSDLSATFATKVNKAGDSMTGQLRVETPGTFNSGGASISPGIEVHGSGGSQYDSASISLINTTKQNGSFVGHLVADSNDAADKGTMYIGSTNNTNSIANFASHPYISMDYNPNVMTVSAPSTGSTVLSGGGAVLSLAANTMTFSAPDGIGFGNSRITSVGAPTNPTDAATKTYADTKLASITSATTHTSAFTAVASRKHTVDATSGAIAVTLPATNTAGTLISVQKSDTSANLVTMSGKINGVASSTSSLRSQYQGKLLHADGTGNWDIIAGDVSVAALDTRYGDLTTAQTIAGVKTFSSSPVVPTPTNGTDAVNKSYADTKVDTTTAQTIAGAKTFSAAAVFSAGLTANATSIVTDTTTGLKIGSATTQKLGFFNATPVVQPTATSDLGTVLSNLGLRVAGTGYPITTSGTVLLSGVFASIGSVRSGSSTQTAAVSLNNTTSTEYQMCNATTAAFTVTLPSITTAGYRYTIKKVDATANAVTIAGTIDGATNYVLSAQYKYVTLVSTTTSGTWFIVGQN